MKLISFAIIFFFIPPQHNAASIGARSGISLHPDSIGMRSWSSTDIKLKEVADVSGDYISLFDIVEKEGLPGDLESLFRTVFLGRTGDGEVITKEHVIFELRYRQIDPDRIRFSGTQTTIRKSLPGTQPPVKMVKTVRAKNLIRGNKTISAEDIEYVSLPDNGIIPVAFEDVIGNKSSKTIRPGYLITAEMIIIPPLVKKGAQITIKGDIIEAPGKTLRDASMNEVIPCVIKGIKEEVKVKIIGKDVGLLLNGNTNDDN